MEIKKVLLPIDGSDRSKRTIRMVKRVCRPEECEIYIVKVIGAQLYINSMEEIKLRAEQAAPELEEVANMLPEFTVHTQVLLGSAPGVEIVEYAREIGAAVIFLTRSSRGPLRKMGSVANYLVKNATFLDVFIMKEDPPEHAE